MEMKYRNILVLFLAAIVFFVGAGVTVVDLCCSRCIEQVMSLSVHKGDCMKTEMKAEVPSCCSQNSHSEDGSLCVSEHTDKCCEAKRVSIDINYTVKQANLLHSMVWTLVPSFISNFLLIADNNEPLLIAEARDPIPIPPRNYLSLIRVLII